MNKGIIVTSMVIVSLALMWGSGYSLSQNKVRNLKRQIDYWKESAEYNEYQLRVANEVADQLRAAIAAAENYIVDLEGNIVDLEGNIIDLENRPPTYVEVPIYPGLKEFQTLEQLQAWVSSWSFYRYGIPRYLFGDSPYDCDDYSMQMVLDAAADGYMLGWFIDTVNNHMIVAATIGNKFYFIEPQKNEIYPTYNGLEYVVDIPERYYRPLIE